MPNIYCILPAIRELHHNQLQRLARTSSYTKDFSNYIFSSPEHYERGWIRVLLRLGVPVGFTCFRHKVRSPETKLYFLVVDPALRGKGLGKLLMEDLEACCPSGKVALDCAKANAACAFYRSLGYTEEGDSLGGNAWRFVKTLRGVGVFVVG